MTCSVYIILLICGTIWSECGSFQFPPSIVSSGKRVTVASSAAIHQRQPIVALLAEQWTRGGDRRRQFSTPDQNPKGEPHHRRSYSTQPQQQHSRFQYSKYGGGNNRNRYNGRGNNRSRYNAARDELLEATKWGKIRSPNLFELFDPSKGAPTDDVVQQRTEGLMREVAADRMLTSILNSWARGAHHAPDAADRCYEVLRHIQKYKCHLHANVFVYGVVINAYAKRRQASKADAVFREMLSAGVEPNVRSFNSVMSAWSKSDADDAPEHCTRLLADMKKRWNSTSGNRNKPRDLLLAPDTVTYNTVIDAYARRGRAKEAEGVFREMLNTAGVEPNVLSFTSVMNAWSKSTAEDAFENCKRLLADMIQLASSTGQKELLPNTVTYTTVIDACAVRGRAKEAEDVLSEMMRAPGVEPNVRSFTSVMNAWSKSNADDAPENCKRLLADMQKLSSSTGHKDLVPNTVTYTTVIDAYAVRGRAKEAEEVLREMLEAPGVQPNVRSFTSVMNAWSKSNAHYAPKHCKRLMRDMRKLASSTGKKELVPNTVSYTTVIDAYAARGRAKKAEEVLREMLTAPGIKPSVRPFNSVMSAWSKSGAADASEHCNRLLAILTELATATGNKDLVPNTVSYNTVIDAYARRGQAEEAEEVLREMLEAPKVEPNVLSFTSVMNAWSKSYEDNAPENCERLLADMIQLASSPIGKKEFAPNTVTYTTVVDAYAVRGRAQEAEEALRKMLNAPGIEPDVRPFNSVMNAWSKSDAEDAPAHCRRLLADMRSLTSKGKKALFPDTVTYNTVIDACARRGRTKEAEDSLRMMLEAPEVEPTVRSFNMVMDACSKSGAADAHENCERLLEEMTQLATETGNKELFPNKVSYAIVKDAFARRAERNQKKSRRKR